jgi:hypothetical protein
METPCWGRQGWNQPVEPKEKDEINLAKKMHTQNPDFQSQLSYHDLTLQPISNCSKIKILLQAQYCCFAAVYASCILKHKF